MNDENRLRKGQVYPWQDVMNWVENALLEWDTNGPPASLYGGVGFELHVAYGDSGVEVAFLCASHHKDETEWTCTYVAPEYALPPLHYYSILLWNEKVGDVFITMASGYDEARDKAEKEVLKWHGYMLWSVKHIDCSSIEAGDVVHIGGG